jgi:predicted ATPase
MKIQSIHIKNFKSIIDLEIIEPNPFTVFVGPNGAGKSNIFEALEYRLFSYQFGDLYRDLDALFPNIYSFNALDNNESAFENTPSIEIHFNSFTIGDIGLSIIRPGKRQGKDDFYEFRDNSNYLQFVDNHSEIFISNTKREKVPLRGDNKLSTSCSNLEKVLKRLFEDDTKREEIKEWLALLIPGFTDIDVISSDLSSTDTLVIYEQGIKKPFTKDLISDGTFNILALLTAVYQSDEPQFLCIEEPENGLNPYVVRKLVDFFRAACEEKGHYIWLNTHSHDLVACLEPEEIIVVDKINGETQIEQKKGMNLYGLDMAEAWLSGALGGGTPW